MGGEGFDERNRLKHSQYVFGVAKFELFFWECPTRACSNNT